MKKEYRIVPKSMNTVHHFWPRGLGGSDEPTNKIPMEESVHRNLCDICNRKHEYRIPVKERNWRIEQLNPRYHAYVRNIRGEAR